MVEKEARSIKKVLMRLNENWVLRQKELLKERLEGKLAGARAHVNYVSKLLVLCKSWGGPSTSAKELMNILKKYPDLENKIIKTEDISVLLCPYT